jgi:hypothetical protein
VDYQPRDKVRESLETFHVRGDRHDQGNRSDDAAEEQNAAEYL